MKIFEMCSLSSAEQASPKYPVCRCVGTREILLLSSYTSGSFIWQSEL